MDPAPDSPISVDSSESEMEEMPASKKARPSPKPKAKAKKAIPMDVFRLQGKCLYLTYPQCSTKKEELLENARNYLDLVAYCIAEEKHADGSPHLHAVLELRGTAYFKGKTGLALLDSLVISAAHPKGKHGNYQTVKHLKECLRYITKENAHIHEGFDLRSLNQHSAVKTSKHDEVAKKLMEGMTLKDLVAERPGYVMMNKKKMEDFRHFLSMNSSRNLLPLLQVEMTRMKKTPASESLVSWLNTNLIQTVRDCRQPRQKQLWIHGPPAIGKTRMISQLRNHLRIYDVPFEEFQDDYSDTDYDMAVFDEFQGWQKTVTFMNQFLEGNPMYLRKKGAQIYKKANLPCIILSNFSPREAYPHVPNIQMEALESRLQIVNMDTEIILDCVYEITKTDL